MKIETITYKRVKNLGNYQSETFEAIADGVNIIKRSPGDIKRVKRNRSRDAFKMRIGMGTVLEQSGDELVEKASGSALCRMA